MEIIKTKLINIIKKNNYLEMELSEYMDTLQKLPID